MNPLSMSPVRGFHHNHCAHSPLRCPSGRRPSSWPSPRPSSPSAAPCPSKASSPRSSLSRFLGIGLGFPASVSDLGYFHYDASSINSYGSSSNVQESGFIDSMERKRDRRHLRHRRTAIGLSWRNAMVSGTSTGVRSMLLDLVTCKQQMSLIAHDFPTRSHYLVVCRVSTVC